MPWEPSFLVALATAFGGSTMRDVLLSRRPFYWVQHQDYVIVIFIMAIFAPFLLCTTTRLFDQRAMLIADAIGLGLFSISGTSIALDADMPAFTAAMMGVVTGVFGSIMRDVLCNDVPLILRDSRLLRGMRVRGLLAVSRTRLAGAARGVQRADIDRVYLDRTAGHAQAGRPLIALIRARSGIAAEASQHAPAKAAGYLL